MKSLHPHWLCAIVCTVTTGLATAASPVTDPTPRLVLRSPAKTAPTHNAFDGRRYVVKFRTKAGTRAAPGIAMQSIADAVSRALGVQATVIDKGATLSTRSNAIGVSHLFRMGVQADVVRLSRALDTQEAEAFVRTLSALPDVEYAARDGMARHTAIDDPWYSGPIVLNGVEYSGFQADLYDPLGGINAPDAWAQGATGDGIVVAVLDTGITDHPDLIGNVVPGAGYDFISEPMVSGRDNAERQAGAWDLGDWTHQSPWIEACGDGGPSSWHGTHVAGTIAAIANNGSGIAGIAHGARILPVRVLGHCGGFNSDIADAITWASGGSVPGIPDNATPAEVINLSLGGWGACEQSVQDAIDGAIARGTTIVVAAGNDNVDVEVAQPANCKGVVAVGSSGLTTKRAFYSNYGEGITLAAPGGGVFANDGYMGAQWIPGGFIWSTFNTGETVPLAAAIAGTAGTSQATPHVAGTVALMQASASSPMTPATVKDVLVATSRMFPGAMDQPLGSGLLDAGAAVQAARLGYVPPAPAQRVESESIVSHIYASTAQQRDYVITVPAGATRLTLQSFGGVGDADLYVKAGDRATPAMHDARSVRPGNNALVRITAPAPGDYFIAVHGTRKFSGVHFRATIE